MRRSSGFRLIGALVACAVALVGPSTAVAHGYQHAEEAHSNDHHDDHHGDHHDTAALVATTDHAAELAGSGAADHPHPRLESASSGRTHVQLFATLLVSAPAIVHSIVIQLPGSWAEPHLLGPHPATGPPLHSRAPPRS